MKEIYQLNKEELFRTCGNPEGLTTTDAKERLQTYGENTLVEQKKQSVASVFFSPVCRSARYHPDRCRDRLYGIRQHRKYDCYICGYYHECDPWYDPICKGRKNLLIP